MNKLHQTRWNAAQQLFQNLLKKATEHNADIMFDGVVIRKENIFITSNCIFLKPFKNTTYTIFEADPNFDHGLYTTIKDFETDIKARISLCKRIDW